MNPNRVKPEYLPLFIDHNRKFYGQLDMTLSPMVLDWDEPSPKVKDAFTKFSPDGLATIVLDFHHTGAKAAPTEWECSRIISAYNAFKDAAAVVNRQPGSGK